VRQEQQQQHSFNGLFSKTTRVGQPVLEGQIIVDFTEAEMMGWQCHQMDHMQAICTLLQTVNHTSTLSHRAGCSSPNQQLQITEEQNTKGKT